MPPYREAYIWIIPKVLDDPVEKRFARVYDFGRAVTDDQYLEAEDYELTAEAATKRLEQARADKLLELSRGMLRLQEIRFSVPA